MGKMTEVFIYVLMFVAALGGPAFATAVEVDFDADFVTFKVVGDRLGWPMPGPGWTATSDIETSDDYEIVGNGMVDSVELALLQEILADPSRNGHDIVHAAWTANWDLLYPQVSRLKLLYGVPVATALNNLAAGMLTIGDGDKLNFIVTIYWSCGVGDEAPAMAAGHNATALSLLGTNGDADNDSITNLAEYTAAGGDRDAYLASNGFGSGAEGEGEGEGEGECPYAGVFTVEGQILAEYLGITEYAPVLAYFGQSAWNTLDLEGFEATAFAALQELPPASWPIPGDGLPDAVQMAMLEAVLCRPNHYLHTTVSALFEENKTFFTEDLTALSAPNFLGVANLLPGMMGTSPAMLNTVDGLLGQGLAHLPHLAEYNVFVSAKASNNPFAGDGDIDGDDVTNKAEYDDVIAAGGDAALAVNVILDPYNFWYGNPDLPALSAAGLVVLAVALITVRYRRIK